MLLRDRGPGEQPVPPPGTTQAEPPATTAPPAPQRPEGLAVGLTETSAPLLWSASALPQAPPGFGDARHSLGALRPRYFRLMVDWSVIQPDPAQAPDFAQAGDGCVRGRQPCAAFSGVRDVLRAVASQQKAVGGYEVLVSIFGVPPWAARSPWGCERDDAAPRSRPITDQGLEGYRALIRAIAALGAAEGVELRWWSPWNEPNGPLFVSPQRLACDTAAPLRSPRVYARLARAMRSELGFLPGDQELVMAELAGYSGPQPRAGGVGEFYDALPDDVLCSASVYAQHAYAERGRPEAAQAPVDQLKAALDRRPCTAGKPIWITETGIGGPDVGRPRTGGPAEERADCRAMDEALRAWDADERVQAAFQYLFRDDPHYPVGLADVGLTRLWPTYYLWRAWGGERPPNGPAPPLPPACVAA